MADDKTWVGGTAELENTWDEADNWDPVGVPVSTDSVYIVSGSVDITGENQADIDLARLVVGAGYSGSIGSTDDVMQINATTLDFASNGTSAYFEGTYTTVTVLDMTSSTTALNLSGDSDTITTLRVLGGSGTITIDSSCNITTTIEQIGASGVITNIADGTTIGGSATLTMDSGRVKLNQAVPTITVFGGDLEATLDEGEVTLLELYGGKVRWKPSAACTITTLTIYTGLFDSRDSTAPEFTITNCTLYDGKLDERSGLENATFLNPISLQGSGEIRYDVGRSVTIS